MKGGSRVRRKIREKIILIIKYTTETMKPSMYIPKTTYPRPAASVLSPEAASIANKNIKISG